MTDIKTEPGAELIVRMEKVNKFFGSLHVLQDIELSVTHGEVVVIIGASGSGKSTLIRCINGLEEFQHGHIEVDGNELLPNGKSSKSLQTIRTEVGMVFQQFNLFPHLSVRDNVTLAPIKVRGTSEADAIENADRLLEQVNIADPALRRPTAARGAGPCPCHGTKANALR
jgi:glutamine transport system ATP-binding protein